MILSVGIDIATTDRIGFWLNRFSRRELGIVFSAAELDEVVGQPEAKTRLATCFSAKEAVGKALGTGLSRIEWTDIMVRVESGELRIDLRGAAACVAAEMGITGWWGAWSRMGQFVMTCVAAGESEVAAADLWRDVLVVRTRSDSVGRAMQFGDGRMAACVMGPEELQHICERREMIPAFAARLAAKYAVCLILRQPLDHHLIEIQVGRSPTAAPLLTLSGASADNAKRLGLRQIYLSLTHEGPHAAAIVAAARCRP